MKPLDISRTASRRSVMAGVLALALGVAFPMGFVADPALAQAGRDSTSRDAAETRSPASDTTAARPAARDTTARRQPGRSVVPADSLPSADARAVLRTINEPLSPAEQVDPPDSVLQAAPAVTAPDPAEADTSGVPIPAETAPLGEAPGSPVRSVFSDSVASAAPGSGTSAPGSAAPPRAVPGAAPAAAAPPHAAPPGSATPAAGGTSAGSPADTCWRLQLAAPTDREEAAAKRAAAESQLLVDFVIEIEQGRHKVRGRDCVSRAAAWALRDRALLSGFTDAFLVRMGPDGKVIPATTPAKRSPARQPAPVKRRSTAGTRR
ncbi:MAG: hypothetical protein ABIS67_02870 [Candidatus Eisenbacteria bacterium]